MTLVTMKKLESTESYLYTLDEQAWTSERSYHAKDDEWENWGLDKITENLRKFVERSLIHIKEGQFQKKGNTKTSWD